MHNRYCPDPPLYRAWFNGTKNPMKARAKDITIVDGPIHPETGGVSLDSNPERLREMLAGSKSGGRVVRVQEVPDELVIRRTGGTHHQIEPPVPMTEEQFQDLLKQAIIAEE